jgi:hypothetical protein
LITFSVIRHFEDVFAVIGSESTSGFTGSREIAPDSLRKDARSALHALREDSSQSFHAAPQIKVIHNARAPAPLHPLA